MLQVAPMFNVLPSSLLRPRRARVAESGNEKRQKLCGICAGWDAGSVSGKVSAFLFTRCETPPCGDDEMKKAALPTARSGCAVIAIQASC